MQVNTIYKVNAMAGNPPRLHATCGVINCERSAVHHKKHQFDWMNVTPSMIAELCRIGHENNPDWPPAFTATTISHYLRNTGGEHWWLQAPQPDIGVSHTFLPFCNHSNRYISYHQQIAWMSTHRHGLPMLKGGALSLLPKVHLPHPLCRHQRRPLLHRWIHQWSHAGIPLGRSASAQPQSFQETRSQQRTLCHAHLALQRVALPRVALQRVALRWLGLPHLALPWVALKWLDLSLLAFLNLRLGMHPHPTPPNMLVLRLEDL